MLRNALDQALGATPLSFAQRMDQTLLNLKEEKEMKRFAFRTVLVFTLITLLLCSTAFALVRHGLDVYYTSRFTAYQEHEPERYEAILAHLQTDVPQSPVNDPDISIYVAETSWSQEQQVLVVSILATPLDPDAAVLHPMWDLDADASYVGKENLALYPDDPQAREEHWLWTKSGFGPVTDMIPADKELLLLQADSVYLDDIELLGDMSSTDSYVNEDGAVHTVLEIRLDDTDRIRQIIADDPDGIIPLTVPYSVTHYTDDETLLYSGGRKGTLHFDLNIR